MCAEAAGTLAGPGRPGASNAATTDVAGAGSSAEESFSWTRAIFSPFGVLMAVYVIYFLVVYTRVYEYVYWELMNLGTRIIGFAPSTHTLLLYVYGGLVLVLGFLLGTSLARWLEHRRDAEAAPDVHVGARVLATVRGLPIIRTLGLGFTLSLLGWSIGFSANVLQVGASGGISLLDIASRWQQSPVLVWFASSQIFFVPALIVTAKTRWQKALVAVLFLASTAGLGLLGARNLPAKLVVSAFLAAVYVAKPKNVWRLAVIFLVLLIVAMGVVGAVSKSGIYGPAATAGLAVGLLYSDSVGTAYNLDRIVQLTPATGTYHGRLLYDSARALIPGVQAEYANFQIGRYLGGRTYFEIGGDVIDRSVSLAPTLLGAAYADWGVPGVIGQMLLLGLLFGYLGRRGRRALWIVPFLATMASYVINGVNAGVHNPHALFAIGFSILVMLVDLVVGGRVETLTARTS